MDAWIPRFPRFSKQELVAILEKSWREARTLMHLSSSVINSSMWLMSRLLFCCSHLWISTLASRTSLSSVAGGLLVYSSSFANFSSRSRSPKSEELDRSKSRNSASCDVQIKLECCNRLNGQITKVRGNYLPEWRAPWLMGLLLLEENSGFGEIAGFLQLFQLIQNLKA